jgi:hypothetical protein
MPRQDLHWNVGKRRSDPSDYRSNKRVTVVHVCQHNHGVERPFAERCFEPRLLHSTEHEWRQTMRIASVVVDIGRLIEWGSE